MMHPRPHPALKILAAAAACACLALLAAACQGGIPVLVPSAATQAPAQAVETAVEEAERVEITGEPTATRTLPAASEASEPEAAPAPEQEPPAEDATAARTPRPAATEMPTAGPSPTATRTATRTLTATLTRWPTITRTITLTPTPPAAALRISRPGLLSKVSSPFRVEAVVRTGDDGKAWLTLIGEDGRTVAGQKLDFGRQANQRFAVSPEVSFEINAAAEAGRLIITSLDSFGRTTGLTSVDLILMKAGGDEINPAVVYLEPYLVRSPRSNEVVSGGTVMVSGLIRPVNGNPVIFELIDTEGRLVAASEMIVTPPEGDLSHTPFQIGIPYRVARSTPVRLVLRQESDTRLPGTVALWSVAITIEP